MSAADLLPVKNSAAPVMPAINTAAFFKKNAAKPSSGLLISVTAATKKPSAEQDRYFCKAVAANRHYRTVLSESRTGINLSEADMEWLDSLVSPLILQGQTPYMILQAHPEIKCSVKTLYNYIASGVLSVRNIDLPRKVNINCAGELLLP